MGLALAPAGFGKFGGDLLVGNFSFVESEINAFDPVTGAFKGSIPINVGVGNTPGGLWGMIFGSGAGNGGDADTLYFSMASTAREPDFLPPSRLPNRRACCCLSERWVSFRRDTGLRSAAPDGISDCDSTAVACPR